MITRLLRRLRELAGNPRADYALAGIMVGLHLVLVYAADTGDILMWGGQRHRSEVYKQLGTLSGLMLTISAAALGLYMNGDGERISWLRRTIAERGLAVFFAPLTGLFGLLVVATAAFLVDVRATDAEWMRFVVEFSVLLVVWRFVRVLMLYRRVLQSQLLDKS